MQTDNAVSNNPRRSQLAVDITAASGETEFTYSCNASVSFVGSETLTEQNSTSITVRGMYMYMYNIIVIKIMFTDYNTLLY